MDIPIYLINLKKNKERLINSIDRIRELNLSEMIIIKNAKNKYYAEKNKYKYSTKEVQDNILQLKNTKIMPTWGSLGCAISHLECWEDIILRHKWAVILEDDFCIEDKEKFMYGFNYAKNLIVNNTYNKSDPTFITLDSKSNTVLQQINSNTYKLEGEFIGTHCYFINHQAARVFCTIKNFKYQIDIELGLKLRHFEYSQALKSYLIKDSGMKLNTYKSDSQYYFYEEEELIRLFNSILPTELIIYIYKYLPKKIDYLNTGLIYGENYYNYGFN